MKNSLKYPVLVLTIGYVYGPPLQGFPTWLNVGIISGLSISLLFLFYILVINSSLEINSTFFKTYLTIISLFVFLMFYHYLISGTDSSALISVLIRMIVFISFSALIAVLYRQLGINFHSFIKFVMVFLLANSALMILMVFFPNIQHLIDNFVYHTGNITNYEERLRFRGLVNIEGDSLGMMNSFYLAFYIYIYSRSAKLEKTIFTIGIPVIFLGILFSGRSGFITLFVILSVSLLFFKRNLIIVLGFLSSAFSVIVLGTYYAGLLTDSAEAFIQWAFFEIPSGIDALFGRHIFFPDNLFTFFFGGEGYTNHYNPDISEIMTSDSGYIRQIFSIGVFLTLLVWGQMAYFASYLDKNKMYLYLVLLIVLSVGHLKTPTLFNPLFMKLLSLILFLGILYNSPTDS